MKLKKYKGGISEFKFYTVYPIIHSISKKIIYFDIVKEYIKKSKIVLSLTDWCELIMASFKNDIYFIFDESELGEELSKIFDYNNPDSFSKYLGNVSELPYHFVNTSYKNTVFIAELFDEIATQNEEIIRINEEDPSSPNRTIDLTESDWCELIAESFLDNIYFDFEDSNIGEYLSKIFDYNNPESFSKYLGNIVVKPTRRLSVTQSYQGKQPTCFAHSAALLIFHNLYKLSLNEEDKKLYLKNNCNLHLDTTNDLEDYTILNARCGKIGASRILLFLYIYRIIVTNFGCDYGYTFESILYYLKTPFQSNIFNDKLNKILIPIYNSVRY